MPVPAAPATRRRPRDTTRPLETLIPRYNVVLLDDQEHTYEYVIEMLTRLCRQTPAAAARLAFEVDHQGAAVVFTASRELAEHKQTQIRQYGPDWRLPQSSRSMGARLERAG